MDGKYVPDPARIAWNPALGESNQLRPVASGFCHQSASLCHAGSQIQPCRLGLSDGHTSHFGRHNLNQILKALENIQKNVNKRGMQYVLLYFTSASPHVDPPAERKPPQPKSASAISGSPVIFSYFSEFVENSLKIL